MQIGVAAEAVSTLAQQWEDSDDENRQGMVRQLFETLVVDLDQQRIVDFRLKPWAAPFLVLKAPLYAEFTASPI